MKQIQPLYKNQIIARFNKISRKDVTQAIYRAVREKRNVTLEEAKNVKILRSNEVKAVYIELGEELPETTFNTVSSL